VGIEAETWTRILHLHVHFACFMCLDEAATETDMAAVSSARKGKLNLEDKVKGKKYCYSYVKDIAGKGKAVHSFFEVYNIILLLIYDIALSFVS